MADNAILSVVSSLRWQLPVKTPSDEAQQDRMECCTNDASARLVRDTALEAPRVARYSLNQGGDQSDPEAAPNSSFSITSSDAEGRAAVERAKDLIER